MVIDWFTVVAQIINFLVLVWLLKRFLYQPILGAIAARERRIADELANAASSKAQAQSAHEEFQRKNRALDEQRDSAIAAIQSEARVERERLLEEARTAAQNLRKKQSSALQAERAAFTAQMARIASGEVLAATRKLLADLADTELETRMGMTFARRLRELDEDARNSMLAAIESSKEPISVRSRFGLPPDARDAIKQAVGESLNRNVRLDFVTAPDGICGVELVANGWKLAWSAADYLDSFEQEVDALLDLRATSGIESHLDERAE